MRGSVRKILERIRDNTDGLLRGWRHRGMQASRAVVIAIVLVGLLMLGVCLIMLMRAAGSLLKRLLVSFSLANKAALPHGRKAKGEQQQHCDKTGEHGGSMTLILVYVPSPL